MLRFCILSVFFIYFVQPVYAAVYQTTDANGNVIYSDIPSATSQQIKTTTNLPVNSQSVKKTTVTTDTPTATTVTTETTKETTTTVPTVVDPNTEVSAVTVEKDMRNIAATQFNIKSPKDQDTLYNQPTIPVELDLVPTLKKGETIQVFLDDKPVGKAEALTRFNLEILERGTHKIHAVLLGDKNQTLLQSNTITIFVHRTSVNNTLRPPNG